VISLREGWLVSEKPAGLLSVPGRGPEKADCLLSRLAESYPDILTVHRLDQATSGLLIWALDKDHQRRLSRLFEERKVRKEYEALICGTPAEEEGEIRLKQRLDVDNRPMQIVDEELGKPSVTRWRVLDRRSDGLCRIRLYPETGRTHQLRLHMASRGWPILGDNLYGGLLNNTNAERMMLHACRIELEDPDTGETLRFCSKIPF
jgi:tRNA pseudouridine32 synthase/23S rRNA pseudouridine746 synthase